MFKKIVALVFFACAAVIAVPAWAQTGADSSQPAALPPSAVPAASCTPLREIYSHRNWRNPNPARGQNPCPGKEGKWRRAFALYRTYRQVAPYRGFNEGDPWLKWLAIPRYIVSCETNGYSGSGRWHAANSSGAVGPYQLLGWGAPYPASTPRQKVENHVIASHLSLSNWACA